jgi:enoyl-CoA hydratase
VDGQSFAALEVTTHERVTTITFNRPESRNAINAELHRDLSLVWPIVDADPNSDVIVLQGSGGSFSAGGDLGLLLAMAGDVKATIDGNRETRRITNELLNLEKPIIAKVDGPAIGLGCTLALFCDFVFATKRSTFADPHVRVGLVAGDGGAFLWPQLIGYARARKYLLTGDSVKAPEAADIGLITKCVEDSVELDAVVDAMVQRLLQGAKFAIQFTKTSINAGLRQLAAAVFDRSAAYESLTQMTEDHKIAGRAFLAGEPPEFIGL